MDVADALVRLRQELNLSQEGLAKKLGVSFTTVNRWETRRARPRQEVSRQIVKLIAAVPALSKYPLDAVQAAVEDRPVAYALFAGAGGFHLGIEDAGFRVA